MNENVPPVKSKRTFSKDHPAVLKDSAEVVARDSQVQPELQILRTVKVKHPKGYMDLTRSYMDKVVAVDSDERAFEFFMNRFRVMEACPKTDFVKNTGRQLTSSELANLAKAESMQLISSNDDEWQLTDTGKRYLNSLLDLFL